MKGHSKSGALVPNTMHSKLVGHVRYCVLAVRPLRDHLHGLLNIGLRKGISRLGQITLQYLHEAMSIAMVVDRTTLARRPYEHELGRDVLCQQGGTWARNNLATATTYQVTFAVALINEVASVSSTSVCKLIPAPVNFIGSISQHELFQVLDVNVVASQS